MQEANWKLTAGYHQFAVCGLSDWFPAVPTHTQLPDRPCTAGVGGVAS